MKTRRLHPARFLWALSVGAFLVFRSGAATVIATAFSPKLSMPRLPDNQSGVHDWCKCTPKTTRVDAAKHGHLSGHGSDCPAKGRGGPQVAFWEMRHWQPSLAKPDASRLPVPNPATFPQSQSTRRLFVTDPVTLSYTATWQRSLWTCPQCPTRTSSVRYVGMWELSRKKECE
jgi:hypothetical protein